MMRLAVALLLASLCSPCAAEHLGVRAIDDTLTFTASTIDQATGEPTDADAQPAYRVYEDETGAAILTGAMALLDATNTAGFYSEQLTLSAANGFEAGKSYSVVITAAVGGQAGQTHRNFTVLGGRIVTAGTGAAQLSVSDGFIAGLAGTITTLDALDADQDAQHTETFAAVNSLDTIVGDINGAVVTSPTSSNAAIEALVDELESRLTSARAGYLDKLNVAGTLAHSDAASLYQADVSGLATAAGQATLSNLIGEPANGSLAADVAAVDSAAGSPVDADVVSDSYTWIGKRYRATNIVEVGDNFDGTLALKPDINPGTTIASVDAVSITGAATVTATNLETDRSKTRAHFTVPTLTETGTYTVVVTVTTVDGMTIPTTCTLKVY